MTKKINVVVADERQVSLGFINEAIRIFDELCGILGIAFASKTGKVSKGYVEGLIQKREKARNEKNWELADALRDELKNMGVRLEDTAEGVRWSFLD